MRGLASFIPKTSNSRSGNPTPGTPGADGTWQASGESSRRIHDGRRHPPAGEEVDGGGRRSGGGRRGTAAGLEGVLQRREEDATEVAWGDPDRQEEPGTAGNPAATVVCEPPTRDDAVQMRMMDERLAPGVEDGEEAMSP